MKNNVEGNIDDLLGIVDYDLRAGYAQKNSLKETLVLANAAYKASCRDKDALYRKFLIVFWLWVAGVVLMVLFADTLANIPWFLGFSALMILWQALVLVVWKKEAEAVTEYQCILVDFRTAVEALNLKALPYTARSVRVMLVKSAVELITAEASFEELRMRKISATLFIVRYGEWEIKCCEALEDRMQAAAKFGLMSDRAILRYFAEKAISVKK